MLRRQLPATSLSSLPLLTAPARSLRPHPPALAALLMLRMAQAREEAEAARARSQQVSWGCQQLNKASAVEGRRAGWSQFRFGE